MGSFFAGIKAGTLSGFLYVGGMAAFNVALLYALYGDVLRFIQSQYSTVCANSVPVNATNSVQQCFQSVLAVDVPYIAFVGFFVVLTYAGLFGLFYDSIPTGSAVVKGEFFGALAGFNLFIFGFSAYFFDFPSSVASGIFMVVWTAVFGYLLGRLYRRYTAAVSIDSQDPSLLRVMVDGRDMTGRTRTFALTSSHRVRAELTSDASFREWQASGGLAIEDPRSFETVMEISGKGALKGMVTKKY